MKLDGLRARRRMVAIIPLAATLGFAATACGDDKSDGDGSAAPSPISAKPASNEPAQLGACESWLDAYTTTAPTEGGPTGLTGPHDVVTIDVVGESDLQHVLIVGEDWVFTCLVTPRIGGIVTDAVRDGGSMALSYPEVTAEPGQVIVVDQGDGSSDGLVGPATITIIGRAAPDVETVGVVMADGTTIPGSLSSGWFIIDGDVGEGVTLTEGEIAWTVVNGDERSSPISVLVAQRLSADHRSA